MEMRRTNCGVRNFGSLYGTGLILRNRSIMATTFYEEQRFGLNYSEETSIVRRNMRKSKVVMTSGRPLESVLKHPKLLDGASRNKGGIENLNRTFDDIGDMTDRAEPKMGDLIRESVDVQNMEDPDSLKIKCSSPMKLSGDEVNICIKYPELRVVRCSDKKGIKNMHMHQVDESCILTDPKKFDKTPLMKRLNSARKRFNVKESIIYFVSKFSIEENAFFFEKDLLQIEQWEQIFSESIYNEEICVFREDGEEFMLVIKKP